MKQPENKIVFVLGMHRSGTSLLAKLLEGAGFAWGNRQLPRAADNPRGFQEQTDVVGLNEEILRHFGLAWDRLGDLPEDWLEQCRERGWVDAAADLIEKLYPADQPLAGIKDPRICRLYPLWKDAAERARREVCPIVVIRDPWETSMSLGKRNTMEMDRAGWLWYRYHFDLFRFLAGTDCPVVRFGEFFTHRDSVVEAILQATNPTEKVAAVIRGRELWDKIVRPDLRHHQHPPKVDRNEGKETEKASRWQVVLGEIYSRLPEEGWAAMQQLDGRQLLPVVEDLAATSERIGAEQEALAEIDGKSIPLPFVVFHTSYEREEEARCNRTFLQPEKWTELCFRVNYPQRSHPLVARVTLGPGPCLAAIQSIRVRPVGEFKDAVPAITFGPESIETNDGSINFGHGFFLLPGPGASLGITLPPIEGKPSSMEAVIRLWISHDGGQIAGRLGDPMLLRRQVAAMEETLEHHREELRLARQEAERIEHALRGKQSAEAAAAAVLHDRLAAEFRCSFLEVPASKKRRVPGLAAELKALPLGVEENTLHEALTMILDERIFDCAWYLAQNPDVVASGTHPFYHYLLHGWKEGRSPSPRFDPSFYLQTYSDVEAHGREPLLHYCLLGWKEGRHPRPYLQSTIEPANAAGSIPPIQGMPLEDAFPSDSAGIRVRPREILFVSGEPHTPGHQYRIERLRAILPSRYWTSYTIRPDELETWLQAPRRVDVMWIWRYPMDEALGTLCQIAKASGVPVFFDVDDLMIRPELADVKTIDGIRSMELKIDETRSLYERNLETFAAADFGTAPTTSLLSQMRLHFKPTFLIPNCFDDQALLSARRARQQRPEDGRIRVGYASGSRTHQRDFAVVVDALVRVMKELPDVLLVVFPNALLLKEFPQLEPFRDRIEMREMVSVGALIHEYARFDINLAPVEVGNPFCEAKSELKYFEAALVETPTIASPTRPFKEAIQDGQTGFLATSEDDWYRAIRDLASKSDLRKAVGTRARREVLWRFGPDRQRQLLLRALSSATTDAPTEASIFASDTALPRTQVQPELAGIEEYLHEFHHCESQITVVMPVYNYGHYAREALDSIWAQTLGPIDLVVVDDASSDGSLEVVLDWAKVHHSRFGEIQVVRHRKNRKLGQARNTAIELADTPYIFPMDPDNLLLPNCLKRCLETLTESGAALVYPDIELFGGAQNFQPNHDWSPRKLMGGNFIDAMALIRRSTWIVTGGYTTDPLLLGWEDYDFLCRLVEEGFYACKVPEKLALYRVHGDSMLRTATDKTAFKSELIERMHKAHPWLDLNLTLESLAGD